MISRRFLHSTAATPSPWLRARSASWVLALLLAVCAASIAAAAAPEAAARPRPDGIDGAMVITGGAHVAESAAWQFVDLAGKEKAHVVVLTVAEADRRLAEEDVKLWSEHRAASVKLRSPADAGGLSGKATGVWLVGHLTASSLEGAKRAALAKELAAVLQHGGVIGGRSNAMAMLSRWTLPGDGSDKEDGDKEDSDKPVAGLDLLPGIALMPDFHRGDARVHLVRLLRAHPDAVGLGIGEGAGLVVQGRRMRVVGEGKVTIRLAGSRGQEPNDIELENRGMADLTQLRRAAIARQEAPFPPKDPPAPEVTKGSLVIVGGGGMPADATKRFIDLAGGPDALIVVLPTANPDPLPADAGVGLLRRGGAKNIQVLAARELRDVEDPKNLDMLRQAKGIWFGGGRQWRFVDAYEHTKAHALFRDVLRRGGVIGGSSAGATIQGDYLCRGSPLNNTDMICEGYERGLGFLPGVAIDQHFAQRKRFADMTALVKTYPQLLGIGIDESTAIVVQGSVAEVMGRGEVHFYDRRKEVPDGKADYESVKTGGRYDLKARAIISAARQVSP